MPASTTQAHYSAAGGAVVLLLVIAYLVLLARSSRTRKAAQPEKPSWEEQPEQWPTQQASDEQIELWARQACEELRTRWSPGGPSVSMRTYFDAQDYAAREGDRFHVMQAFKQMGALMGMDDNGELVYRPDAGLQQQWMKARTQDPPEDD